MHDDQFTATQNWPGSGHENTAFSTHNDARHHFGVNVVGTEYGVYGEARIHGSTRSPADVIGGGKSVRVCGRGGQYGVIGEGFYNGVLGDLLILDDDKSIEGNNGIAVYGKSYRKSEIGVLGENNAGGVGVKGQSHGGTGGDFISENDVGVKGQGGAGPGGEFRSSFAAQIRLVLTMKTPPTNGRPGDLIAIHTGSVDHPVAELWFCSRIDPKRGAIWRQVQLAPEA